jgi:hypothetical protein
LFPSFLETLMLSLLWDKSMRLLML